MTKPRTVTFISESNMGKKTEIKNYKESSDPKDAADHLEKLHDKVYSRLQGYKVKSRFGKDKTKSAIPGFGYYFRKK